MQSFILDRHTDPSNPVMKVTQDDKFPIYDSQQDAESDLANLEENQIIGTKESKFDVDDMKQYIRKQNLLSDYEQSTFTTTNTPVQFDGELTFRYNGNLVWVYVNDVQIASAGDIYSTSITIQSSATISFKKGDNIRFNISITGQYVRYYKDRDYSDR